MTDGGLGSDGRAEKKAGQAGRTVGGSEADAIVMRETRAVCEKAIAGAAAAEMASGAEARAGTEAELRAAGAAGRRARFVVGLSGGADSMCLTHALTRLREPLNIDVVATHVNHMLRGQDAEDDLLASRALCEALGARFIAVRADVAAMAKEARQTIEEAGREARYAAFEAERARLSGETGEPVLVAVAHNMDDLAETTLMNALRGSGIDGLAAMARSWPASRALRPLLGVSRSVIESYCSYHKLRPVKDKSNDDGAYARNRVRNTLMPLIRSAVNPRAGEALARLARNAASDAECLWGMARAAFERAATRGVARGSGGGAAGEGGSGGDGGGTGGGRGAGSACGGGDSGGGAAGGAVVALRSAPLAGEHPAILARVALMAFERAAAPRPLRDLRREHVEAAAAALARPSAGKVVCAPGGLRARCVYGGVTFFREAPAAPAPSALASSAPPSALASAARTADSVSAARTAASVPVPRISKTFLIKDERVVEQVGNISYNSCVQFFDAEAAMSGKSAGALELRRRMPGDRFFPIRSPGRKSLKDYFIDEKIPREERGEILLLADGSEIMWVIGRRASDAYKVTDATRVVLRVELERNA